MFKNVLFHKQKFGMQKKGTPSASLINEKNVRDALNSTKVPDAAYYISIQNTSLRVRMLINPVHKTNCRQAALTYPTL